MWLLVIGLIERMLKVALLALAKFVLDTDMMLWLILNCGVVYVCLFFLNAYSETDRE